MNHIRTRGYQKRKRMSPVLTITLRLTLINGQDFIRILLCLGDIHVPHVPYEVLEQFVSVLLLHHLPRGFNDIVGILDELMTVRGVLVNIHREVFLTYRSVS